jgi:2-polyprenyl-6-methoxyphenol hydroxylase-like FAD-dependent oxidoreductase
MSQTPVKILITGGGIAGPSLAYWLTRIPARAPLSITILERSPVPRLTGQSIDIREVPVTIMRRMGIEPAVRACRTPERGIQKVTAGGRVLATFMSTGDPKNQTMTSEYEILRADLARVCTELAEGRPGVRIVYGDYVSSVSQDGKGGKVRVEFTNGKLPTDEYDLVVGADGLRSRMRPFVTGRPATEDLYGGWNAHIAYFTIPMIPGESTTLARIMNYPRGRSLWFRPSNIGMGAYMVVVRPDAPLDAVVGKDVDTQKRAMVAAFEDRTEGDVQRTLKGMLASDDFYYERISQVRASTWHAGRIALVGDAGYCPTVFSGMGTSTAIFGAYVMAGELIGALGEKGDGDIPAALARYQTAITPFVKEVQDVWGSVVGFAHPYSAWGVRVLETVFWFLGALRIAPLFAAIGAWLPDAAKGEVNKLPEFPWGPE